MTPHGVRWRLRMWRRRLTQWPPVGGVRFGNLRGLTPVSRLFGYDRGLCIDRYYIEQFLARHATDIRGRVLEIGDDTYLRKFGAEGLSAGDVLHVTGENPKATIVADLTRADQIGSETYDCIICTQTLQFIFDVRAALKTLHRILRPSGVLLATAAGISQVSRYDMDRWGEYWRFTTLSARRLFEEAFPAGEVAIDAKGNVLSAIAFLHGLAAGELQEDELEYHDRDYEVLVTIRAVKARRLT